jgi:hypothetical protein
MRDLRSRHGVSWVMRRMNARGPVVRELVSVWCNRALREVIDRSQLSRKGIFGLSRITPRACRIGAGSDMLCCVGLESLLPQVIDQQSGRCRQQAFRSRADDKAAPCPWLGQWQQCQRRSDGVRFDRLDEKDGQPQPGRDDATGCVRARHLDCACSECELPAPPAGATRAPSCRPASRR